MSLNINKNFGAIANGALLSLNSHQTAMGKAVTRVSTGMRVNSPADDASAYMASKKIQADSTGYTTLANGIQTTSAKLNAADAATSSILDVLNAMKAKAIEYQNAAASGDSAASTINTEFANLTTVLNAAINTKYNGTSLLDSSANAYTSIYTETQIAGINSGTTVAQGKITASWDIPAKINDQLTSTEIDSSTGQIRADGSATMVSKLTEAISSVVTEQGKIGAALEAMEYSSSFLSNIANAQETAYYSITEADMAKEMTSYVRNNVLAQASQAMIAQANQSMASVLNLLQ